MNATYDIRPAKCARTLSEKHMDVPARYVKGRTVCSNCGVLKPLGTRREILVREAAARAGTDIVRAHDPETSRLAAEKVTTSGKRDSIRRRVFMHVQDHPGAVRDEVAEGLGLRPEQVWRRASELVRDGALLYGEARQGNATGHQQQTLWPVT